MATDWTHRYVIVVGWQQRQMLNSQAASWDPNPGGDETFGRVRLSADGTEPPSHTACNTKATDAMQTQILDAMSNGAAVDLYEWDGQEGPYELWQRALDDMGLEVIEEDSV